MIIEDNITLVIQINGKVRSKITVDKNADEESVREIVLSDEIVQKYLSGLELKKFIYVPGRIVSLIV